MTRRARPRSAAKVGEPAVTVRELAKEAYEIGRLTMEVADPSNPEWTKALKASPEGCALWLARMVERFTHNVKLATVAKKGKPPNLRTSASTFREPKPEEAFILCTWWANKEANIAEHLADTERFESLKGMLLRGTFAVCARRMSSCPPPPADPTAKFAANLLIVKPRQRCWARHRRCWDGIAAH